MDEDELSDDALWEAFTTQSLAAPRWTHAAHLRVAWMHLERWPFDEAHLRVRVGIIKLNASHGLVETAARGYHETITRALLALVAQARAGALEGSDSLAFVRSVRLPSDALLAHYTRERLLSVEARARFLEPDLLPLPR